MSSLEPITRDIVTRGYETDFTAHVPMHKFLRFFEYLRWECMKDDRLGLVEAVHQGHFFVVRSQTVEILRHVGQGTPLRLTTHFEHAGRSAATVRHEAIRITDSALVARARVVGAWLGPSRRLVRLPDKFRTFARAQAAALGVGPSGARTDVQPAQGHATSFFDPPEIVRLGLGVDIQAPTSLPADTHVHTITVPPRDIDIFSHVNAATWLRYCDDARLDPGIGVRPGYCVRTALHYRREALRGDRLDIHVWPLDDRPGALGFAATPHASRQDPMIYARMDTAPGASPVSAPAAS